MSAYGSKQEYQRHRSEISIQLRLAGADKSFIATVFAAPGERPSDILNDNRAFIPVRLGNGETMIIAKTQIASIVEARAGKSKFQGEDFGKTSADDGAPDSISSAYAALRIAPTASLEEIRAAYKSRIKAVHPDTLTSLGLDEDIARAAVDATQKVNAAYRRILKERGAQADCAA